MNDEKTITRIWGGLEELNDQLTSAAAEGLSQEQLAFVDSRLSAILERTREWFAGMKK